MSLIKCPECGREVSDAAHLCPGCGYPIAEKLAMENAGCTGTKPECGEANPECGETKEDRTAIAKDEKTDRGWIGIAVIAAIFLIVAIIAISTATKKNVKDASTQPSAEPTVTDALSDMPTAMYTPASSPTPLPHISWTKQYYVDDFNDPTNNSYIRGHFVGTFSNSATSGSRLDVYIFVDHNLGELTTLSNYFRIRLIEYGTYPVTYSTTKTNEVEIKIKINGAVYNDNPVKLSENEIYISSSSRLYQPFLRALLNGDEISVVIEESKYSTSTYRFQVDSYGLDDLEHNWRF